MVRAGPTRAGIGCGTLRAPSGVGTYPLVYGVPFRPAYGFVCHGFLLVLCGMNLSRKIVVCCNCLVKYRDGFTNILEPITEGPHHALMGELWASYYEYCG